VTSEPDTSGAYATAMESLWTSNPTNSVLYWFIADLRLMVDCKQPIMRLWPEKANPRCSGGQPFSGGSHPNYAKCHDCSAVVREILCLGGLELLRVHSSDAASVYRNGGPTPRANITEWGVS